MFTKDLRSITPAEAYRRASPEQRRHWFPDGPPELEVKAASPYAPPPAQAAGLPPELETAVARYQAQRFGDRSDPICPQCKSAYPDGQGTRGGYCAHRAGPGTKARQQAEAQRHRLAGLLQQARAGQLGNPVRVVSAGQAVQEDSLRAELNAALDRLLIGP
jgi:hypothetical protein